MFSRLSSFSGPLSPFFRIPVGGFTTSGLILRYLIKDSNSYGLTNSVTDLQGNSNATLNNGPTFSSNGYLNFDGSNDYLLTDTSLNSKLSPANTSTVISYFLWIYPQDNGVIVSELGQTTPNTAWHDSQIEMVSGTLKFAVWTYVLGNPQISSSISTPLNSWYYVGITYDGTTLKAWVNGNLAGTALKSRLSPNPTYALIYGLGVIDGTNLGDGTYAKLKLGDFHVYNIALSQQQVLNNYNATKNNYIYTSDLLIWLDANDPQSFYGSKIYDMSGNYFTHSFGSGATSSVLNGVNCFDCNSLVNGFIRVDGTGPTLSTSGYTYVAWAMISPTSSNYRTLYRSSPNDHPLLVNISTDNLGFWDNDGAAFVDSGYDVTSISSKWVQYSVVGDSSSSVFYINDVLVGTASYGAGGNKHDYFGAINGQPFGYIGNMMLYNTKLTQAQIKQNYDALKHVYE